MVEGKKENHQSVYTDDNIGLDYSNLKARLQLFF